MNLSETAIALGMPATVPPSVRLGGPLAWRFGIGPEAADRLEDAGLEVEFVIREHCEYHATGRDPSDQPRTHHECADCEWDLFWRYDRETADRAVAAIEGGER